MSRNKDTLTIIVNGQSVEVDVNQNAPLHTVVQKALQDSGNLGQPPANWELRDSDGNVLDLDIKISDFHFSAAVMLYLSLKAGVGG